MAKYIPFSSPHKGLIGILLAWLLCFPLWAAAQDVENSLTTFRSRPDIRVPILNVTVYHHKLVTPGYIFISPYRINQDGPLIYNHRGHLVWSGHGILDDGNFAFDFHPCRIGSQERLCFLDMHINSHGHEEGRGWILDQSLKPIKSILAPGGGATLDEHEFNVVDDGTSVLTTFYETKQRDLSEFGGPSDGYLWTCMFWNVNLTTGDTIFFWDSIDHVELSETYSQLEPTPTFGNGLPDTPWDYFHINSVDKNQNGDYLVSSRLTNAVYKISGTNGTIIWRLGGRLSDFSFDPGLNFSGQHHARWLGETDSMAKISLFDDASNGKNATAEYSSGLILHLDMKRMHASLLNRYIAPHTLQSTKLGSLLILPNGHAFSGWGDQPYITEHTPDGSRIIFEAHFADNAMKSYRAYKGNFTTFPDTFPAVYASADSDSRPTTWHMSWNGATELKAWRIYASQDRCHGYKLVGQIGTVGFETAFSSEKHYSWAIVEAVDEAGVGLRNSSSPIATDLGDGDYSSNGEQEISAGFSSQEVLAQERRDACPPA